MNELSEFAIKEFQKSVSVEILKDKDMNEYTSRSVYPLKKEREVLPFADCLKIFTLTGLVDFCLRNKETGAEDPAIIHVMDHTEVALLSNPFGETKQRTRFVRATFKELLDGSFTFGAFYEQEQFIIGLQSLFEPTPQRAEVLKVIGTIKENQVREFSDDGVTQSVSAKAGVALVQELPVPNPVILRPYRTFREIEQPESPFILRVRQGKGEKPVCALFEADGGKWKLEAIIRIKEYLEDKLELPIIA